MINCADARARWTATFGAMIGSTRIGAERVVALVEELGHWIASARPISEGILDACRPPLSRLPSPASPTGDTMTAEEAIDNDCFEPTEIAKIRVRHRRSRAMP